MTQKENSRDNTVKEIEKKRLTLLPFLFSLLEEENVWPSARDVSLADGHTGVNYCIVDVKIKQLQKFNYLGYVVTNDRKCDTNSKAPQNTKVGFRI